MHNTNPMIPEARFPEVRMYADRLLFVCLLYSRFCRRDCTPTPPHGPNPNILPDHYLATSVFNLKETIIIVQSYETYHN